MQLSFIIACFFLAPLLLFVDVLFIYLFVIIARYFRIFFTKLKFTLEYTTKEEYEKNNKFLYAKRRRKKII